jgi:hypothetical protein
LTSKRILVGALAIIAVALVTYFPILESGFHYDDWGYVESVGRLGVWQFIGHAFNPMEPSFLNTYRPLQGLETAFEYALFGTNAVGYHLLNIVLHIVNSLLLCALVWTLTRNSGVAFLAGLFYASMPVFSVAVFLPSAVDTLATSFYLSALWSWTVHLKYGKRWAFALTHILFLFGLLGKEFVATLPAMLFLIDRVIMRGPIRFPALLGRYFTMAVIVLLYLRFETLILPLTGIYYTFGFALGPHILVNAERYLWALVFPWPVQIPYVSVWGCLVLLLLVLAGLRAKSRLLVFAGSLLFFGVAPVVGLVNTFDLRFLYFAGMAPATAWGWLTAGSMEWLRRWRLAPILISSIAVALVLLGSVGVSSAATSYTAEARRWRAPFRDISQQHATFAKGSYLYFIRSPFWLRALSGMFFVRYGDNINVGGTDRNDRADLRTRGHPLIYYFDDTGRPIEIQVEAGSETQAVQELPAVFDGMIQFEGYELSTAHPRRGEDLAVLLYWRATQKVPTDYQVFVHLVDGGNTVAGVDGPPGGGSARTSSWSPGQLIADGIVLSVPPDLRPDSNYQLEIGLYDLPTMRRISIRDEQGAWVSDKIVIGAIAVQ